MGMNEEYTPELKSEVAIEALKGKKSNEQIAAEYGISTDQVTEWRDTMLASMSNLFSKRKLDKEQRRVEAAHQKRIAHLQAQVDKRQVELDWLRRKMREIGIEE
jgi:transposase-like protein